MIDNPRGLFITGTDTGVGKTYVAALIAQSLRRAGRRVGVYKPVASGCPLTPALSPEYRGEGAVSLISEDAVALWEAAGRPGTLEAVCPQRFAAPLAPHLAAKAEGRSVDPKLLRSGLKYWQDNSDIVIVEGAGGLLSPISDEDYVADLAFEFGYPLVVVAANRIGVINQALQTLMVAKTYRDGITIAGVVLNDASLDNSDPSRTSNYEELCRHCKAPVFASVKNGANSLESEIDWWSVAQR